MSVNSKIKEAILYVVLISVIVWWAYLTFSNPDLTRTQLVLTFWREWLGGITVVIVMALLLRQEFDQ